MYVPVLINELNLALVMTDGMQFETDTGGLVTNKVNWAMIKTDLNVNTALSNVAYLDRASNAFTGLIGMGNGAVGTPSLYFTGETNTGFYLDAASSVSLSCSGVQTIKLNSNGVYLPSAASLYLGSVAFVRTGANNSVRIGDRAGDAITGGGYSVCIGPEAQLSGASINSGVAIGYQAARGNSKNSCVFVGRGSGTVNTGDYVVYVGAYSGGNATGSYVTGIGYQSAYAFSGSEGLCIGYQSGYGATSGTGNTFVGALSGWEGVGSGAYNTFVGTRTAYSAGGGSSNSYFGFQCGYFNEGSYNSIFGSNAARANPFSGSNLVGMGYETLRLCTSGSNHVCLGYQSGYSLTTESGCIFIGYQSGYSLTGSSNLLVIANNSTYPIISGVMGANFAGTSLTLGGIASYSSAPTFTSDNQIVTKKYVDDEIPAFPLSIANGGTNSSTALSNDRVMISSSGAIVESSTITTSELGLLNGISSVSTGTADNDKFVTKGYVDDQVSGASDWVVDSSGIKYQKSSSPVFVEVHNTTSDRTMRFGIENISSSDVLSIQMETDSSGTPTTERPFIMNFVGDNTITIGYEPDSYDAAFNIDIYDNIALKGNRRLSWNAKSGSPSNFLDTIYADRFAYSMDFSNSRLDIYASPVLTAGADLVKIEDLRILDGTNQIFRHTKNNTFIENYLTAFTINADAVYDTKISDFVGEIYFYDNANNEYLICPVVGTNIYPLANRAFKSTNTSATKDNASTINFYYESGTLRIQNKTSNTVTARVGFYALWYEP